MGNQIQERWKEFNAEYANYGSGLVIEAILDIGESLRVVFGYREANKGMRALYAAANIAVPDEDECAAVDLAQKLPFEELRKLKIYRDLVALNAYAYFGLPISYSPYGEQENIPETIEERQRCIENLIEDLNVDSSWMPTDRALHAANARWKLDTADDKESVSQEELAALAQVSIKSIRNLLSPSSGRWLQARKDGSIAVSEARRWLNSRPDFKSSVWQLEETADCTETLASVEQSPLRDVLFIPMAKDGTYFSPEHKYEHKYKHSGCYRIGPKENEQTFENYLEALEVLNSMETPMWRRPGARGRWGIVTGVTWTRKTLPELSL